MLRITASESAARAKSYFGEQLSRDEYLSEGQEIVGRWGGKLAEKLGLYGTVDKAAFDALCDGINPLTGGNLTARTKENRTPGYDWTFSVPKSVSLLALFDDRIIPAFQESVRLTMRDAEREMKTRVRIGGRDENRVTGNLVYGEFLHKTARPTRDVAPDVHLHMHVWVANVTEDPVEGKLKAGQFRDLKRDAPFWQASADARMALKLKELGYEIERSAKGWEVLGLEASTLAKFSHRTTEIEAEAKRLGIDDAGRKAMLGASTRQGKDKDLTWAELMADWMGRLDAPEREAIGKILRHEVTSPRPDISLERAFDWAKLHAFERVSVLSEKRLMAEVLRRGIGSVSVEETVAEAGRAGNGLLTREVDAQRLTSTPEILREELSMLAWARDGRGVCMPLASSRPIADQELSPEQQSAVLHVWKSMDRVMLIRGAAGVGKTRLMSEVVRGVEQSGTQVWAFAPSADASRGTLRAEGFSDANTLASLLTDPKVQEGIRDSLVWIDEAGQVGSRDMARVFQLAHEKNARVLLSGDTRQHSSVNRGDVLRLLEQRSGLRTAEVLEIRRQSGQYREAVKALSRGQAERGYRLLDALDFLRELPEETRHKQMAADYVEAIRAVEGPKAIKEALCIAPTHSEGAKISAEIRERLKGAKRLGSEETHFVRLKKAPLTEAERSDAVHYRQGDVVQLVQNLRGFSRGERLTVVGHDPSGSVQVERADGERVPLPTWHPERLQVFTTSSLAISKGETIRITNNGFTRPGPFGTKHRLDNGSLHVVKGLTPGGDLKLANGWVIPKEFGHIDHGYCQTSFSSQSRTVKRVFVAQGAESLPATDLRQFYVSVSRGKSSATVYCESKSALFEAICRSEERLSAVEMMDAGPKPPVRAEDHRRHAELNARLKAHEEASREARVPVAPIPARAREQTREAVHER